MTPTDHLATAIPAFATAGTAAIGALGSRVLGATVALTLASCAVKSPQEAGFREPEANGHWGPFGLAPLAHRGLRNLP